MACMQHTKANVLLVPACACELQENDHLLPRSLLQWVVCDECSNQQYISQGDGCLRCGNLFAAYFCTSCGIANDKVPEMVGGASCDILYFKHKLYRPTGGMLQFCPASSSANLCGYHSLSLRA